jgi:hypothetical protein
MLLLAAMAGPALAERDAAIKAQEGSVDHWIEYYKKQRAEPPSAPARPPGEREKVKEEREEPAAKREVDSR